MTGLLLRLSTEEAEMHVILIAALPVDASGEAVLFEDLLDLAAHGDGVSHHDAAHGQHRDIADTAADVDHHTANGGLDVQSRADGGGLGLLDEVGSSRARLTGGLHDGPHLHLGDTRRHADQHAGRDPHLTAGAADEVAEHLEGNLVLADGAVLHGAQGVDVVGGTAQHLHGVLTHLDHAVGGDVDGHHRGLLEDDALSLDVDQHRGRSEINGDIPRKFLEHRTHLAFLCVWGRGNTIPMYILG